jgi:hypothetical protein
MTIKRKVIAGAAAALAVGGTGAGYAATQVGSSPSAESKAIVNDAAKQLGVKPSELSDALEHAFTGRVDAAVKAGRLTKEEGEELKQRIQSGEFPLFGPPALGHGFPGPHPFFHGLDSAAEYLGLTEAQLRTRLNDGQTLAQIAKAEDRSVDGLKHALVADAKEKLDAAVDAGRLTRAEADRALTGLEQRIDDLVNGQLRLRVRDHRGFGFRHRGFDRQGPPPSPGAAA